MLTSIPKNIRAILIIMLIVIFYVGGATILLEMITFDHLISGDEKLAPFGSAYSAFLTWVATSYGAGAVSICMSILAFRTLLKLTPSMKFSAIIFSVFIGGISILLLGLSGNAAFNAAENTLCFSEGFCAQGVALTPAIVSEYTKLSLNTVFQIAAVTLLCGFIFSLADGNDNDIEEQKPAITLFYCAALLLTLIVLTDLLFFEFMTKILPEDSTLLAYQKGFVVFFAIMSSVTLLFALLAGIYLGLQSSHVGLNSDNNEKASKLFNSLIGTASISRSLAAFSPILVTLISSFADGF